MSSSLEIMQGFTGGQIAAILNKISSGDPEKLEALLRDEFEVQLVERVLKLADKNGRIIPRSLKNAVCDPNKDFHLIQPSLEAMSDYAARLVRFQEAFRADPVMSAVEFEGESKKLIVGIKDNQNLVNLLNGVYLPVMIPRLENFTDCGKTLEQVFLPAVKSAYEKQFPGRKFYNYREGDLVGRVGIVSESRHDRIVAMAKERAFVALYFPAPLHGFSVFASREQMATLPESLILSGGFDAISGMVMYPDVLARDWHTPGYDLSALFWQSPDDSLFLEADDDSLHFDDWDSLGHASDNYSSGLLFLGSA